MSNVFTSNFTPSARASVRQPSHMPHATQRLHKYEYAAGAVPDIFGIQLLCIPWAHRQRLPGLPQQLTWLFVHAYHRYGRVIGHFVDVQDILHTGCEFRVFFGRDAPVGIVDLLCIEEVCH